VTRAVQDVDMKESYKHVKGYVYILEVKDIDLPVCKIGMTSRHP
jgi:hypothetical protein